MFAKRNKLKLDGKNMTAIFYDNNKTPIKPIHVGASSYADYTVAPHDEDKRLEITRIIKPIENLNNYLHANALSRNIVWENEIETPLF